MGRIGAEVADVRFTPPEGLRLEGESGQAMVDWRINDDGTVSILAVDGVSLAGGVASEEPEPEMEESEMEGYEEEA